MPFRILSYCFSLTVTILHQYSSAGNAQVAVAFGLAVQVVDLVECRSVADLAGLPEAAAGLAVLDDRIAAWYVGIE